MSWQNKSRLRTRMNPVSLSLFALVLMLPIIVALIITLVPSRRQVATGIVIGNPLHDAPLANAEEPLAHPLVHLCRTLSGSEIQGYILGLRHQSVTQTAPILYRHLHGADPALQLYSQGIFQQGKDRLQQRFQRLLEASPLDTRCSAWLLETGLALASHALNSTSERETWLARLVTLARQRLAAIAEPSPSLLSAVIKVFTAEGLVNEAAKLAKSLPNASPLQKLHVSQTTHRLHQLSLAA